MSMTVDARPDEPGPGSQTSLRQANESRVVDALRSGATTQAELARRTALAPSTVSGIVRDLAEAGVVRVEEEHGGRRGRLVELALEGRVLVGVDIGQRHVTVALATLAHDLVGTQTLALVAPHDARETLAIARQMADGLLDEAGLPHGALLTGGLCIPAPVGLDGRVIWSRSVIPGWAGVDLSRSAGEAFGIPFHVDNDANAGALAEQRWGAGRDAENLVYLKLGHGIGAGLILGGALFRGATGVGGEIGHTIVAENGEFCRCGNRGCLETVANVGHILALLGRTRPHINSAATLIEAALAGDPACVRALGDTGREVGVAVANLCNLLNPELLVVGGDLAAAGEILIGPLRDSVQLYGMPSAVTDLRIVTAGFGPLVHVYGAISLAMWGRQATQRQPGAFAR